MKNTLFLLLLFCGLIISCSNEDDSSDLNTLDSNLVGSWNTSEDLTGNTYTYNTDGTAVYENHYSITETDVYNGAWDIIEGNVLIAYYPDPDEEWDDNWKDHPTMKYYFELLNDCTLQLTEYNDESQVRTHYRESELTAHERATQPYIVEFTTGELVGSWVSVGVNTKIYFNDCSYEEKHSDFDYENKIVEVEIPEGTTFFELKFYIEDVDETTTAHMKFYGEEEGNVVHEETIVGQTSYTNKYNFQ